MISKRISKRFSYKQKFDRALKDYNNALKHSGYSDKELKQGTRTRNKKQGTETKGQNRKRRQFGSTHQTTVRPS